MVFNFDAIGFILGLGYVMGLRSSLVLCAGGVLSNLRAGAADLDDRQPYFRRRRLSGADPHRPDDGHGDLPRLRALRGRRRHSHRGNFGILKSMRIVAGSFGIALHAFACGEPVGNAPTATFP